MDFIFYSVDEMNYLNWYSNGKLTSISWDKLIAHVVLYCLHVTRFDLLNFSLKFLHLCSWWVLDYSLLVMSVWFWYHALEWVEFVSRWYHFFIKGWFVRGCLQFQFLKNRYKAINIIYFLSMHWFSVSFKSCVLFI